jgi:hypothetical protein
VTSGDASIAPLTLASRVVECRLLPSRYRVFAACSPPAGSGYPLVRNDLRPVMVEALADGRDDRTEAAAWVIGQ